MTIDLDYRDPYLNGALTYTVAARDGTNGGEMHRARLNLLDDGQCAAFAAAVEQAVGAPGLAADVVQQLAARVERDGGRPNPKSMRQLFKEHPHLRPPVITGLLRRGETMNLIAPAKTGKSWLAVALAIAKATGRMWLGSFATTAGKVLILDNELHTETISARIPKVTQAMGVVLEEFIDEIHVESLRGRLRDIHSMAPYFHGLEPGRFPLIIIDAFYRILPPGTDENDNGAMAAIYNVLDAYADRLGCSFVLIHHSTKGNQSGKAITDVGAGAGAQSRATDTHLILRQHEEDGVVVLDGAVRSWAPIQPLCLGWEFPLWRPRPELDPTQLRQDGGRRKRKEEQPPAEPEMAWDVDTFTTKFLSDKPRTADSILLDADAAKLSERKAARLLASAEESGKVHRWHFGTRKPVKFATVEQPVTATAGEIQR